jgi:endonuclease G
MIDSYNKKIQWVSQQVDTDTREAMIGLDDFQNPWFLRKGSERSRAVCLVSDKGTGWLIAKNLVMTNWHVLRRPDWAIGKFVFFNYEKNEDGSDRQQIKFALDPEKFFYSNETLDFAVVAVTDNPGDEFGIINIQTPGDIETDIRVNIIQHPNAGPKKIAIRDNGLKYFDDQILQYWTDTDHGSSGSPLFNDKWEIIGLHFRYDSAQNPNQSPIIYNEGHNIKAILSDLLSHHPSVFD